jgi:hypothetical protein
LRERLGALAPRVLAAWDDHRVRLTATVAAFGERIAAAADGRWAVAYGDWVTLWDGTDAAGELTLREPALDLRFDGEALQAAPSLVGEELPPLSQTLAPWHAVAATWAGERLLVAEAPPRGGHEQRVRLYDGRTRAPGAVLWADSEWMRVEAVAAGGGRLAAAALEVRVWDAGSLDDLFVVPERGLQVRRIVLAGETLIAGYADGHLAVHERAGWQAHADEACALALHPDGERLASGGWDGRVGLWTLDGELLEEASVGAEVAGVAFLGGDRLLALHRMPATGVSVLALG